MKRRRSFLADLNTMKIGATFFNPLSLLQCLREGKMMQTANRKVKKLSWVDADAVVKCTNEEKGKIGIC